MHWIFLLTHCLHDKCKLVQGVSIYLHFNEFLIRTTVINLTRPQFGVGLRFNQISYRVRHNIPPFCSRHCCSSFTYHKFKFCLRILTYIIRTGKAVKRSGQYVLVSLKRTDHYVPSPVVTTWTTTFRVQKFYVLPKEGTCFVRFSEELIWYIC